MMSGLLCIELCTESDPGLNLLNVQGMGKK